MSTVLSEANLPLPLFCRGKVRDTYDLGDKLLIISTDRLSPFDVVLPNPIPDKGLVLNQLSCFWFEKTREVMPNHLVTPVDTADSLKRYFPDKISIPDYLIGRSMITLKAERTHFEGVGLGHL